MKRIIAVVAFLIARPAVASDTVFAGNPDLRPSIGLSWSESQLGGSHDMPAYSYNDYTDYTLQSGMTHADASLKLQDIELSLRVPVSNDLTLEIAGGQKRFNLNTTTGISPVSLDHINLKGSSFTLGARYYLWK